MTTLRDVGVQGVFSGQEEVQLFPDTASLVAAGGEGASAADRVRFTSVGSIVLYLDVSAIDSDTTLDIGIKEIVGEQEFDWPGDGFTQAVASGKQRIEVDAPVSATIEFTATLGGADGKTAAFTLYAVVRR